MRNILITLLTGAILSGEGCKKFVEIPHPPDVVISTEAFSTDEKATSVITSIYGNMINGAPSFANYLSTEYPGMSSDELDMYDPPLTDQEFITNNLTSENSWVHNLWKSGYKDVYYSNSAIEGIEASASLSVPVKRQLLGEAKFIRAFSYFYLVNFFGDVPLELTTDYKNNMHEPRSNIFKIYDQIAKDLKEAVSLLSPDYPTNEPVRPNKYVAETLLARVYLYLNDWQLADSVSTDIIDSHKYILDDSLKNVFLADSKEAIWQLIPKDGYIPELLNAMLPLGNPQCIVSKYLLNAFEDGDKRRLEWIDSINYQGSTYYYPSKYKSLTFTNEEYYMVFRYAEVLLIRAESRAHENDILGGKQDLDMIRHRAGLGGSSANDSISLLQDIMHERQTELFAEWGHRWFDLRRTGKINSVLSTEKINWKPAMALYPIPLQEMEANPSLEQNTGY
jgi:hypothetical protein